MQGGKILPGIFPQIAPLFFLLKHPQIHSIKSNISDSNGVWYKVSQFFILSIKSHVLAKDHTFPFIFLDPFPNNNFYSRPAFFPAPEFIFNLIFGKERASIVTQSQVVELLTER